MACAAEERAQAIIETDDPAAVIQAMSPQEAYLTIKDAWEGDGRLLLPYVATEEIPAFIDLDCWDADGLNLASLIEWFWALADISLEHLAQAVAELDLEISVTIFAHYIEIAQASSVDDNVPDLLAAGFETLDDVFFLRFKSDSPDNELLKRLLKELYAAYPQVYRTIMYSSDAESFTSLEEEAFLQRRLRLTELGFVPADEALTVYRRQKPEKLMQTELDGRLVPRFEAGDWHLPAVYRPAGGSLLAQTLDAVATAQRERLGFELVYLVNKLIMADFKPLNSSSELNDAVAKAAGLIAIGLDAAADRKGLEAAQTLSCMNVEQLFSLGYNLILDEQQRYRDLKLERGLLPSAERELIDGLLRKRPLYGTHDFETPDDLRSLRATLARLEALKLMTDGLAWQTLDLAATNLGGPESLDLENLALTMLALNVLDAGDGLRPLRPEEFRRFAALVTAGGKLKPSFTEDLNTFIKTKGVNDRTAAELAASLSARLEGEIAALDAAKAEARFVTALIVAQ